MGIAPVVAPHPDVVGQGESTLDEGGCIDDRDRGCAGGRLAPDQLIHWVGLHGSEATSLARGSSSRIVQRMLYGQQMLTISSRIDAMSRIGRAMADPTRSRILLAILDKPGYPAELAKELGLTRTNVSNHLTCLRGCGIVVAEPEGRQTRYEISDPHLALALTALVDLTLAVDESVPCIDPECPVPGCCDTRGGAQ